jgi:hypothetical protein
MAKACLSNLKQLAKAPLPERHARVMAVKLGTKATETLSGRGCQRATTGWQSSRSCCHVERKETHGKQELEGMVVARVQKRASSP